MRLVQGPSRAIPIVMAAAGVALVLLSLAPHSIIEGRVSSTYFAGIMLRLRAFGLVHIAGAYALYRWWRPLMDTAFAFAASVRRVGPFAWREERTALLAVAAVTLAGAIFRGQFLADPIRNDEGYTFLRHASQGGFRALFIYGDTNNHPLHSLLVRLCFLQWGNQEWVLRLPAYLAGILIPPASYWLARVSFDDRWAGVLASAFCSASPLLVVYSALARGYSIETVLFLIAATAAVLASRTGNGLWWLLFAGASALGFYTVPTMLYGFAGIAVWLGMVALRLRNRSFMRNLAVSAVITVAAVLLLYAPMLVLSGPSALATNRWTSPIPLAHWPVRIVSTARETWLGWHSDWPPGFRHAVWSGCAFALLFGRRRLANLALAGSLFGVPFLLTAIQRVAPYPRVWLYLLPVCLAFFAAGCAALIRRVPSRRLASSLLAVFYLLACFQMVVLTRSGAITRLPESGNPLGCADAARFLRGHLRPDDIVVSVPPVNWVLQYYLSRWGFVDDYVLRDPNLAHRLVLVANDQEGSLDDVLTKRDLRFPRSELRFVRQFASTAIWIRDPAGAR